jgi:uncharacterized protein DUF5666
MKTKLFAVLVALTVLASVIPITAVFASTDHEFRFTGKIQALPQKGGLTGDWKVGGRTVHVSTATQIDQTDGVAAQGARVYVEGWKLKDGSINATSVDVLPAGVPHHAPAGASVSGQ